MPKTGILDAKKVAFKCQNCSCFKQNFFGVLNAKKWHFKCQKMVYQMPKIFHEMSKSTYFSLQIFPYFLSN